MRPIHIIISSEHSGNRIPDAYKQFFTSAQSALKSHRGFDLGAKSMASAFSQKLNAPLIETEISRLLVDCNRSLHKEDLFSEFTRELNEDIKNEILERYYFPHRYAVEKLVRQYSKKSLVLHLSIHTFTPFWLDKERLVDIGILFDEKRELENSFCQDWINEIQQKVPNNIVRPNEPYQGGSDGLTSYLRNKFAPEEYMGIEIEVNNKYANREGAEHMVNTIVNSLQNCLLSFSRNVRQ